MLNTDLSSSPSEYPIFSVGQVSHYIKVLIEQNFEYVKIRGEVSGFKLAASGHAYFNLKDQQAVLACTCWKPVMSLVNFELQDGLEIVVTGKLTTYSGQSKYQLTANSLEPYGLGSLMQILEQRRKTLAAEGLFDQTRKKPLPFLPETIGIITSPTGAVIRDMLHRIEDRFPTRILLWPVNVQGEKSALEVAEAIKGFNTQTGRLRPQLIIVARGGGSIEDLWSFNEEIVVRAAANSEIPIISAIGHETDHTLLDLVADLRAPTPTAAAEFAVPVRTKLQEILLSYLATLRLKAESYLSWLTSRLQMQQYRFSNAVGRVNEYEQYLDLLGIKLSREPKVLQVNIIRFSRVSGYVFNPRRFLELMKLRLDNVMTTLMQHANIYVNKHVNQLKVLEVQLGRGDVSRILSSGFSILSDTSGNIIDSVDMASVDQELNIQLSNGQIKAKVIRIVKNFS